MSIYQKAEQYRQNPSIETFKAYFDAFQALPELTIYRTDLKDRWGRPVYIGEDKSFYVDVDINDKNPSIHSITKEDGEPIAPVLKYTISEKPLTKEFVQSL